MDELQGKNMTVSKWFGLQRQRPPSSQATKGALQWSSSVLKNCFCMFICRFYFQNWKETFKTSFIATGILRILFLCPLKVQEIFFKELSINLMRIPFLEGYYLIVPSGFLKSFICLWVVANWKENFIQHARSF